MQKLLSPAKGLEKNMIHALHVLPLLRSLCGGMQVIVAASVTRTTLIAGNLPQVPRRLVTACMWDEEGYLCLWEVGISNTTLLE
jgi:hypothetical protein